MWNRFLQFYAPIGWVLAVYEKSGSKSQSFGLWWVTHDGNQMSLAVFQKVSNDGATKFSKNRYENSVGEISVSNNNLVLQSKLS